MNQGGCQEGMEAHRAIFINGHPNGSIMVRLANVEERQDAQDKSLKRIEDGIEAMPKKLFLWLSILVVVLTIFQFFIAPALRKDMNLGELPTHELSQDAKNPPLVR